jgi:MoaA/NifB/PqqE/SkfB family radical SAM enzyme
MGSNFLSAALVQMVNHRNLRRLLAPRIDDYVYQHMVHRDSPDPDVVQIRRYQYLSAMLHCILRNIDKGIVSPEIVKRIIRVFVQNNLTRENQGYQEAIEAFQRKWGELPPTFLVISPTQRCNLHCTGCYADSTAQTAATLPYHDVERVVREAHDLFGCRFITISGGEPFLYESEGKSLLDLCRKHDDVFFLVYTNGTMIRDAVARELADCANVTPAISVEGFEAETDERRGPGTFGRILAAADRLKTVGVPFGISVTATGRNVDLLLTEEFYDYYFQEVGATYMWQFQLMPIGRGKDQMASMVSPGKRVELFRMWERLLENKKYCLADFWNSGVLSRGCIAYGRSGGYFYVDWHGNVTPCVFIPYYVDNIYELYAGGKTLADALFSDFMRNGRQWQKEYGLDDSKRPQNWLMPCSIRDHYEVFRRSVLPAQVRTEDEKAREALESADYLQAMNEYDAELRRLTEEIWEQEYLHGRRRAGEPAISERPCHASSSWSNG